MLQVNPCRRLRLQEIKTHPWLSKQLPIYATVPTFSTMLKEKEFELDHDILSTVRSYGMPSLQNVMDEDRISKVIKRRTDDSFVTAYQLLKDEKDRRNQLQQAAQMNMEYAVFEPLQNKIKFRNCFEQRDYLFGCTFQRTARMVIEVVFQIL